MKRRTFIAILGAATALFTGKPTKALALMEGPKDVLTGFHVMPQYVKKLLLRGEVGILEGFRFIRTIPRRRGKTIRFRRYAALPKPFDAEREGPKDTKGFFVDSSLGVVRVFRDGTVEKWSR